MDTSKIQHLLADLCRLSLEDRLFIVEHIITNTGDNDEKKLAELLDLVPPPSQK